MVTFVSLISFTLINCNSSVEKNCYFSSVYSSIQFIFYQYGLIHIYSYTYSYTYYWVIIQYHQYFFAQIVQMLAIGNSILLVSVFLGHDLIFWGSIFDFLGPQDNPLLSCVFPAPELESATSPGSPSSFDWRYLNNLNSIIIYLKIEIHKNSWQSEILHCFFP